ncbi:MAG: VCBS repeat-containing protein [Candidatus Omnitrophica bacterium]|nr:VCBS repeat-containing protein [Candidatus Omnitrophota bacterium]
MFIVKLIKVLLVILVFLAAFFPIYVNISAFAAKTQDFLDEELAKRTSMPNFIEYEGVIFERDPCQEEYEQAVYADLDGDAKDELIVRFSGKLEDQSCIALTVIYSFKEGNNVMVKTILGGETPISMELFDVDKDGITDLILRDHSGVHYTLVMIYSYKDNDYKCLFENGTSCFLLDVNTKIEPVRITIGRENWDKEDFCYGNSATESLLEVWEWSGERFAYSPSLSTIPLLTEEKAIEITCQHIKKTMGEIQEETGRVESEGQISDVEAETAIKGWISGTRALQLFKKKDLDE